MKYFLVILGILSAILFCFNYQICEYFYKNDITKWWGLKQNIYNVILMINQTISFLLIFIFLFFPKKDYGLLKILMPIMTFNFVMCGGNITDRLLFNINSFDFNDMFFIVAAILLSFTIYSKKYE